MTHRRCHTSIPVASRRVRVKTTYHTRCVQLHDRYDSVLDASPQRKSPASRVCAPQSGNRNAVLRNGDAVSREKKTAKHLPDDALPNARVPFVRVFCPVLNFVERFSFGGRLTDGRTGVFFGRQSEEALLLVIRGKLSSNLTKLG